MVIAFRDFSMYQLSGEALRLADHLIVIMSFVMVGMSYQMPVELVVIVIQSDQFFKGIPAFIRFRSYRWVKKLTN